LLQHRSTFPPEPSSILCSWPTLARRAHLEPSKPTLFLLVGNVTRRHVPTPAAALRRPRPILRLPQAQLNAFPSRLGSATSCLLTSKAVL
jgi:hypothetical protein